MEALCRPLIVVPVDDEDRPPSDHNDGRRRHNGADDAAAAANGYSTSSSSGCDSAASPLPVAPDPEDLETPAAQAAASAAPPRRTTSRKSVSSSLVALHEGMNSESAALRRRVPWLAALSTSLSLPLALKSVHAVSRRRVELALLNLIPLCVAVWSCLFFHDFLAPAPFPGTQTTALLLAQTLFCLCGGVFVPLLAAAMDDAGQTVALKAAAHHYPHTVDGGAYCCTEDEGIPTDVLSVSQAGGAAAVASPLLSTPGGGGSSSYASMSSSPTTRTNSFSCWPALTRTLCVQFWACVICWLIGFIQGFHTAATLHWLLPNLPAEVWRSTRFGFIILMVGLPFQSAYHALARFLAYHRASRQTVHRLRLAAAFSIPLIVLLSIKYGTVGAAVGLLAFSIFRCVSLACHVIYRRFRYGWQAGVKVRLYQRHRPSPPSRNNSTKRRLNRSPTAAQFQAAQFQAAQLQASNVNIGGRASQLHSKLSFEDAVAVNVQLETNKFAARQQEVEELFQRQQQQAIAIESDLIEKARTLKLESISRLSGGMTDRQRQQALSPREGDIMMPIDDTRSAAAAGAAAAPDICDDYGSNGLDMAALNYSDPIFATQPAPQIDAHAPTFSPASLPVSRALRGAAQSVGEPAAATAATAAADNFVPRRSNNRSRTMVSVRSVNVDNRMILQALCLPTSPQSMASWSYWRHELPTNLSRLLSFAGRAIWTSLLLSVPTLVWAAVYLEGVSGTRVVMAPAPPTSQPAVAVGIVCSMLAPILVASDACAYHCMDSAQVLRYTRHGQAARRLVQSAGAVGSLTAGSLSLALTAAAMVAVYSDSLKLSGTFLAAVPLSITGIFFSYLAAAVRAATSTYVLFAIEWLVGGGAVAAAYALRGSLTDSPSLISLAAFAFGTADLFLLSTLWLASGCASDATGDALFTTFSSPAASEFSAGAATPLLAPRAPAVVLLLHGADFGPPTV